MADHPSPPVRVNRAPVLTLWAAVVAERLGYPPETALSLASAIAGTAARAKARRLGIQEEHEVAQHELRQDRRRPEEQKAVRLLGREVPVTRGEGGGLLAAEADGRAASAAGVRNYVARAFGARLGEVQAAMEALAASLAPEELNRVGFRLYEQFHPEVPEGVRGWGAKSELRLECIQDAARGR